MSRLFARHRGRHCRHGSITGWSALSQIQVEGSPRRQALELLPVADDLIPFADYRHPYDSPKDAA